MIITSNSIKVHSRRRDKPKAVQQRKVDLQEVKSQVRKLPCKISFYQSKAGRDALKRSNEDQGQDATRNRAGSAEKLIRETT